MRVDLGKNEYQLLNTHVITYLSKKESYFDKCVAISSLIPVYVTNVYGGYDFSYKGEFDVKVWSFKFEDEYFFILSANGRGTDIESTTTDVLKAERFVDGVLSNFKDNQKVQTWLNMKKPTFSSKIKRFIDDNF